MCQSYAIIEEMWLKMYILKDSNVGALIICCGSSFQSLIVFGKKELLKTEEEDCCNSNWLVLPRLDLLNFGFRYCSGLISIIKLIGNLVKLGNLMNISPVFEFLPAKH